MEVITAGRAVVGLLKAEGVRFVFGLPAVLDFVVARERMLQSLEHYGFYPEELVERARRSPLEAAT